MYLHMYISTPLIGSKKTEKACARAGSVAAETHDYISSRGPAHSQGCDMKQEVIVAAAEHCDAVL